jgi:hypothetical protein
MLCGDVPRENGGEGVKGVSAGGGRSGGGGLDVVAEKEVEK